MEPVVSRGRGMHILGFVPVGGLGGLRTTPIARKVPASRGGRGGGGQVPDSNGGVGDAGRDIADKVRGPSSWKHGRPVYTHGNYSRYYNYRQAEGGQGAEDLRLGALTKRLGREAFRGKEVLDVGCNDGIISRAIAHSFGAKRVVGVDIDADLIERAVANCGTQEPTSGSSTAGHCPVEFRAENFLSSPLRRPPAMEPERFDVVLCLSVTKWVHFANGDKGITRLFKRCIKRLRPGALFVLEPQLWASYKKKRHISPEIRETVASIQLRPEAFDGYIVDSLGLERVGTIAPSAEMPKGFQRPIHLYRKPHPPPEVSGAGAAEGQDEASPPEQPTKKKNRRLHSEAGVEAAEGEDEASPQEPPKKKKRREVAGAEAAEGQDEVGPPEQAKKKKKRRPDTEEPAGAEAAEGQDEASPREQAKKKKNTRALHAEAAEGQDEVGAPEQAKKKKKRLPGTEAAPPQDAAAPPKKKKKTGQADTR